MGIPVGYAVCGGVHIAYQVVGSGPRDLVFILGDVTHLEHEWNDPGLAHMFDRLTGFCRLIRFDRRGMGLSDRAVGRPTIEDRVEDVLGVMDAVGSTTASIVGLSEGGAMALWLGAKTPDRIEKVMVYAGSAGRPPDEAWRATKEVMREYYAHVAAHWGETADSLMIPYVAPSMVSDSRFAAWHAELQRLGCSPSTYLEMMEASMELDVRSILGDIRVPTAVLHRSGDPAVPLDAGRELADQIPGAEFVELPGADHLPWVGEIDALCDAIERVVTGRVKPRSGRGEVPPVMAVRGVTAREFAVVRLLATGASNVEIGQRLHISVRTVESHCSALLAKLDLTTRSQLIAVAASVKANA